jgi:uncharacterized protein YdaU (DUF1376 family)
LFLFWEFCGDAEMHYYQFNISDYRSATGHLTNDEDLAYRRLLDMYYDMENKIPLDTQWVAKRLRMDTQTVQAVLDDMFVKHEDGYFHARCQDIIQQYHAMAEKNRANGKLGGRKKNPTANPLGSDSQPIAKATINYELETINQELSSVSKDTGVKPPLTPDEIIFGYGVPLLTNAGATDKSARSFLGSLRKAHGDETLVNTLRDCIRAKPIQPLEWLAKALPPDGIKPKLNKQESLEASNRAVVEKLLKKEGFV